MLEQQPKPSSLLGRIKILFEMVPDHRYFEREAGRELYTAVHNGTINSDDQLRSFLDIHEAKGIDRTACYYWYVCFQFNRGKEPQPNPFEF